jgi:hypothetical protein
LLAQRGQTEPSFDPADGSEPPIDGAGAGRQSVIRKELAMKITNILATLRKESRDTQTESSTGLYTKVLVCAALTITVFANLSSTRLFAWYFFTTSTATLVSLAKLLARLTWPIVQHRILRSPNVLLRILPLLDEYNQLKQIRNGVPFSPSERRRLEIAEYYQLRKKIEELQLTVGDNANGSRRSAAPLHHNQLPSRKDPPDSK